MLRKRFDKSNGGRKPNLRVYPATLLLGNRQEEIMLLAEIYGMSVPQAREHRRLYGLGNLYVTHNAKAECEYQVLVNTGVSVPQQGAFGADVAQIAVKRMDNKTDPFYWTDLQEIKNALFGTEVEAIELFPRHSRRKRGDNEWRYLWAFPEGEKVPVGWDLREVADCNSVDQNDPATKED